MPSHRNSQKRFYGQDYIYFVVTKTLDNYPYFQEPIFCELLIEELKFCKELKKFKLFAFSIIYDHLNLLLQPSAEYNMSQIIKSLKENVSRDINYIIHNQNYKGDTSTCRLQIRRNITNFQHQFADKNNRNNYPVKFQWQKSFHDHVIIDDSDFENHFNYTVYNPAKHGLPGDWPYASLNYPDLVDELGVI